MSPLGNRPAGGTSGDIEVEIRGAALCLRLRSHGRNGGPTRRHVYNVIEMQLRGESGQLFRLAQRRTGIPVVDSPLPANPKESASFRGPATRTSCLLTGPVGDPDGMRGNQPYRACNQHSYLADVKHNTAVWVLVWVFAAALVVAIINAAVVTQLN